MTKDELEKLKKLISDQIEELGTKDHSGAGENSDPDKIMLYQLMASAIDDRIEALEKAAEDTQTTQERPSTPSSSPPPTQSTPVQKRRGMSRLMAVLVVAGFVLAMLFGYWFATEGYTLQWPIKEFNIEFQTPIVAPDSSDDSITGSEMNDTGPDFGDSPPSGSGANWICEGPAVDQTENTITHSMDDCVDP